MVQKGVVGVKVVELLRVCGTLGAVKKSFDKRENAPHRTRNMHKV